MTYTRICAYAIIVSNIGEIGLNWFHFVKRPGETRTGLDSCSEVSK